MRPTVTIVTPVISPYQVELFDAVAELGELHIQVVYLAPRHSDRQWSIPQMNHDHVVCSAAAESRKLACEWVMDADLSVFSWYADPLVRKLMNNRARSTKPWCYWGERPGASGPTWLGRLRRRHQLGPLHRSNAPIWAMGRWALNAWKEEFGAHRLYRNVPYFSDLSRFARSTGRRSANVRRFLFSGSLIARKGVDILAKAFQQVAESHRDVHLDVVGSGDLGGLMRKCLTKCNERVRFLGFRDWAKLPHAYHEADVLIAPSRYDGWGLIVPEGLAAGLPVIATNRMGAAIELITPHENGWLIGSGDLSELVQAITEAAQMNNDRLEEMSRAACESIVTHSLQHGAQRFVEAAYTTLVANEKAIV